jgi:4-amino-4-deoxy-L-arabinose transferase-like glycosyltransferase
MTPPRRVRAARSAGSAELDLSERGIGTPGAKPVVGRRSLRYGVAFVLLVTTISLIVSAQGWKSRMPAFDLLTYMYAAQEFLASGTIPQHGDTGSYGSYKPPGTAWLMMPGTALFGDPRSVAYVGTAVLHFGALLGTFLLAWRSFGVWPACLAVLLYGFSTHGLFLAGSLWPNGRPDVYVWFVLFTTLWATQRSASYLAAAVTVWGIGMYVDMAIAPALFILPVVWLLYRPPVRAVPLLIAGVVVLAVWSPYLRLQATRDFADIKSQLFLRYILPDRYQQSWCDPGLTLATWQGMTGQGDQGAATEPVGLSWRLQMLKDKVLSNFTGAVPVPGVNLLLLVLVLATILLCSVPDTSQGGPAPPARQSPRLAVIGMLLVAAGLVLYGIVSGGVLGAGTIPASGVAKKLPQMLILLGLILWGAPRLLAATRLVLDRRGIQIHPTLPMRLLVICLVVPWLILVIVAEPAKPERFWWVWPAQAILLAASVAYLLPRLTGARPVVVGAQMLLAGTVMLNPFLWGRIASWRMHGWGGADPEEVQVVDYVAQQVRGDGKLKAAIGYQLFLYPFMASYHITNPVYRAGAELEIMLRYRHGIVNLDQCAEGVSVTDEYRILQRRPKPAPDEPQHYFELPDDNQFRLLRRFDLYDVLQRK